VRLQWDTARRAVFVPRAIPRPLPPSLILAASIRSLAPLFSLSLVLFLFLFRACVNLL